MKVEESQQQSWRSRHPWHFRFAVLLLIIAVAIQYFSPDFIFDRKSSSNTDWKNASSIYDFTVTDIDGNDVSLEKYRGHVCIIVNVACKCGFTGSNYPALEDLYEKYGESKGLKILAFPCNQFGGQEPGSENEIKEFVKQYNVKFDMFSKIKVNGGDAHPLFQFLKNKQGGFLGDFIKWNFTKFLINKEGIPVKRFAPTVNPKEIESSLESLW